MREVSHAFRLPRSDLGSVATSGRNPNEEHFPHPFERRGCLFLLDIVSGTVESG